VVNGINILLMRGKESLAPVMMQRVPTRANGRLTPIMPSPLIRCALTLFDWSIAKKTEDAQRRELRLPKAIVPASRRDGR
jgi:hypothetical protein